MNKLAWFIDYLVNLPETQIIKKFVVDPLRESNIVESTAILNNLHSIVYISLFYHLCFVIGTYIIFPPMVSYFNRPKGKGRKNLAAQSSVHLVSFIQSIVVLYLSINFIKDPEQNNSTIYPSAEARIMDSHRNTEIICIYALGYFIWDAYISFCYSGLPFVLHGVVSTIVYFIGLRPYLQFYAPVFLIFELSNPALNIRWFMNKYIPKDTSKLIKWTRIANSLLLLITFFIGRIVWGWYQIGALCWDFYQVRNHPNFKPIDTYIIVGGNLILDVLNAIWFSSMVTVAYKVISGKQVKRK
ncbi:hypothetical protein TBLA_0F01650 [Henningerozyma blattae CBS 6284]|uniref:TLC domain-containing protein n=1 Tax=Henningerozyma blattae (strain ATCC 34711 / CBS 6284 / DSM 70876 / NBRC 10599 / NRRL Y-10934 / UCD 77-7) TaxID=1071380 RepID=I2H5Q5_HENB6|nr:hypothetical protein TBLA_0F01650 [Tetrapisispora blattae CBS 6284]CCH61707.1 hypothetical protein TBLA_0F01650 [Tetrapisispora blattae CBS 6284]